ncbi:MAG: hypothetical protein NXI16_15125 [Alphaproteobacteria bacterium]|nr:hypothetical protein [Alphaproteobacteria bacterium]
MIREAIEWLLFPNRSGEGVPARRMGYVAEQIGLIARHRRHGGAWADHLEHSRRAIADVAAEMGGGERCVVLGSGALFDVPLDDLASRFREVVLVDIAHPWRAVRAARGHPGVRLAGADLTGIAAALRRIRASDALPEPEPFDLDRLGIAGPVDLVVSVNLVSQLPIVPLGVARAKRLAEEEALEAFGHRLVEAHLAGLRAVEGRRVLIGDIERLVYDPGAEKPETGTGVGRVSALFDVDLPEPDRAWWWDIAPRGEMDRRYAVANRVGAWLDF